MYLCCDNCGDLLYFTQEEFDNEAGRGTYFRDEKEVLHHFCTPYCLGLYVTDNYTRKKEEEVIIHEV